MKIERYTVDNLHKEFPNDDACLDFIFQARYGHLEYCPRCAVQTKFYRIKTRKYYKCPHCAFELYPLANTIFHKSETPLTKWFLRFTYSATARTVLAPKSLSDI